MPRWCGVGRLSHSTWNPRTTRSDESLALQGRRRASPSYCGVAARLRLAKMKIVVATTIDDFWQPQAMAMAEAMRREGWEAGVVTPRSLVGGGGLACDALFCLG